MIRESGAFVGWATGFFSGRPFLRDFWEEVYRPKKSRELIAVKMAVSSFI